MIQAIYRPQTTTHAFYTTHAFFFTKNDTWKNTSILKCFCRHVVKYFLDLSRRQTRSSKYSTLAVMMTILSMREKLQRVLGNVRIMRTIFGHFIPRPMRYIQ